jgi:hypothetical protein
MAKILISSIARLASFALAVALLCLQVIPVAAIEPKAGAKCPGPNATASFAGFDWKCVKKGKKFVWQMTGPQKKKTVSIYTWIPKDNLVTAAIQRRISTLRQADKSLSINANIEAEGTIPADALKSIRDQHDYMIQAYPEVFPSYNNRIFIYQTAAWARAKAVENKCPVPGVVESPPAESPHSEAVPCEFDTTKTSIGSFMNWSSFKKFDAVPSRSVGGLDEWANQFGQEGGGSSIQSFYNKSRQFGNYNPLPAWYEQGGQDMFTSIALAVQSRKWRQASLSSGQANNCNGYDIANTEFYGPGTKGCEYDLGAIANELLIALYGFDGPIAWFKAISLEPRKSPNEITAAWRSSFKEVYGLELSQFYSWANAYGKYMVSDGKSKFPSALVTRLEAVGR